MDHLTVKQFLVTPAAGKRLIAKGLAAHPLVREALAERTIVIVAGTTNGYIAEELLTGVGATGFSRRRFVRGITMGPGRRVTGEGRLPDESGFPGDVVIQQGQWVQQGKTIFDVVDDLKEGDLILKGANALDLVHHRAAILIGNPKLGTIGAVLQAAIGRRAQLILPVGLEKRVAGDLDVLAQRVNAPGAQGARLLPVTGMVYTELDAIATLSGATAELVAAGGVAGAEGAVWLAVSGSAEQVALAEQALRAVAAEPPFEM